jgi:hypothetical protein
MMDYPETSGNLRKPLETSGNLWKPAAEVSEFFILFFKKKFDNRKIRKPARNLRGRFPKVNRGFLDNP